MEREILDPRYFTGFVLLKLCCLLDKRSRLLEILKNIKGQIYRLKISCDFLKWKILNSWFLEKWILANSRNYETKKNLEKFKSLVLTQWIQDIFDIFFIQSKMECISCEIAATLLFTNLQVRHQKWFGPIVQGTSTGSRSSRSVNFSKELRKAFQWIKIKKGLSWAFV